MSDMELEHEPQHEDDDLMLGAPQFILQSPPPLVAEIALSKKGDVFLLDDDLVMDMYYLSFNKFQKRLYKHGGSTSQMITHHLHSSKKG